MKNLENRDDIELLVDSFYRNVERSEIGYFFTDVAKVDWAVHLPKMYLFWETLLFGSAAYKGNPMAVHFPVNEISAMEAHHFETWLQLWTETVREHFQGATAELAIYKAGNIARLMSYKMEQARKHA